MSDTLLMETTQVAASKSAAEIIALLVARGANQINTQYDAGKPVGLQWTMSIHGRVQGFNMPVKIDPVYKFLSRKRKGYQTDKDKARTREQAERVAWRQLFRWVQVQMCLIDIGMVEYSEVFFAYVWNGRETLHQAWVADVSRQIAAPERQQ